MRVLTLFPSLSRAQLLSLVTLRKLCIRLLLDEKLKILSHDQTTLLYCNENVLKITVNIYTYIHTDIKMCVCVYMYVLV